MATKSFCGGRMSSEKTSSPTTTAASVLRHEDREPARTRGCGRCGAGPVHGSNR